MIDPYLILGVARDASRAAIKLAFRRLSKQHHPDLGGDKVRMAELNEAWSLLKDTELRSAFDEGRTPVGTLQQKAQHAFHQMFVELLGSSTEENMTKAIKRNLDGNRQKLDKSKADIQSQQLLLEKRRERIRYQDKVYPPYVEALEYHLRELNTRLEGIAEQREFVDYLLTEADKLIDTFMGNETPVSYGYRGGSPFGTSSC